MLASDSLAVELVALLEQRDQLLEEARDLLGLGVVAGDGDLVAADVDRRPSNASSTTRSSSSR